MATAGSVLIVEDEQAHGQALAEGLTRSGFEVELADSGRAALKLLNRRSFDVVVTDYKLGGDLDGLELLRQAKSKRPETEVVLITAYGNEQLARIALRKENAYDYITKPINLEELREVVARAAKQAQVTRHSQVVRTELDDKYGFDGIVAASPAMKRILNIIRQVAPSNITVLLEGESGTGKDLLAGALHRYSPRRDKRMVTLDCAGLSEGVLESELFGHTKGAFTGALASRKGRFEYADGGTLFLDEIGEMPLPMQAKLLRVLECKEVVPVGANEPIKVDVRLVCATNRDLIKAVKEKKFREDLFFRIKGVTLKLPPLRERREDIPLLIEHFLRIFSKEYNKQIKGITAQARDLLIGYDWPGNVRELRNNIESMVVLAGSDTLDVEDVPEDIRGQAESVKSTALVPLESLAGMSMVELEKEHIRNTLKKVNGNREQAAKSLGIGPRTLYRKLKEYNIS